MTQLTHRFIDTNGIRMHLTEQGEGPLVLLLHGFPEGAYSWRHQLPALAQAGYHAVAPDQRGYGQSDCPHAIEAYNIFQLTGDIVGLVHALGEEQAIVAGHDWGAMVSFHCALLRPDMFTAVVLFSVPYISRSWRSRRPTDVWNRMAGEQQFYQTYFQEPGRAEAELEADVPRSIRMIMYSASGDPPPEKRWHPFVDKGRPFMSGLSDPDELPAWLTEADVDHFAEQFKRTGFRGALNWYRNIDHRWEQTPFLCGAKLMQPALFVAGDRDVVVTLTGNAYDNMESAAPNLTKKVLLPGAGHWIQQERPEEVNSLLIEFLSKLHRV
jgi:pimeloyl-ACP methyl ester carboxylesterase